MIVVETTPVGENEQRRYRFRIDAERKAVVRRAIEIRFQANQPWQAYTRIESHDYQQVAPGFWLPNEVKYESVEVTAELTPEKLSWSYKGSNRDWKVNQELQPTDADDLVQEVFSAVAKQVGDWLQRPDRGSFRPWLLRMARNIAVNLLTRKPFGATGIGGNEVGCRLEEVLGQGDEFSSRFDLEYRREVFRWAAEQVRESVAATKWQAFHLTHLEGVSTADAARQLGISVGNVYIARSRVMNRLRELAEEFEVRE